MRTLVLFIALTFAFNISWSQTITVLTPNGGESLSACQTYNITWNASGTSGVYDVAYSIDNGVNWSSIATNYSLGNSFVWPVANIQSTQVKIRVRDANATSVQDQSDNYFTINAALLLTSPNGGENWQANTNNAITWVSTISPATNLTLEYSLDGGNSWVIITTLTSSVQSYNWLIPGNLSSSFCKVRIYETSGSAPSATNTTNCKSDEGNGIFTISPATPVITVTAPNTAVTWGTCQAQQITWTYLYSTVTNAVKIEYSIDNGANWITIVSSTTSSPYNWTIPATPSTTCLIKVSSIDYPSVFDVSNVNFTIATPTITVTAPNTAVTFNQYTTQVITWSSTNLLPTSNVSIEISSDGGVTWSTIIASTPNDGSQPWTVGSQTASVNSRIRITSLCYTPISDISNFNFTIAVPAITVTAPNTNALFYVYSSTNVTWTAPNLPALNNVRLDYSIDNGINWLNILLSTPNDGTQAWTIPNTPSNQCLVKVSDVLYPANFDISNVNFTIASPAITVNAPNISASYCVGAITTISWIAPNLPATNNVNLDYSINNGITWIAILNSTPNDGSQGWTIPNNPSGQCLVKVSDALDPTNFDISNVVFTISNVATNVTTPNGGEVLIGCTTQTITFARCGTTGNTKIEFSPDGGVTWNLVAASVTTLSFAWTVPNVSSSQCLIKTTDLTLNVSDVSNAVFTINPSLKITSPNGGEIWQVGGPTQTITWVKNGTFTTTLRLDYSTNNGASWTNIATGLANTTTSYIWTIPNTPSTQCLVRVYESATVTVPACKVDQSDATFTISGATPIITVTSPNTVLTWYTGASNNITWNYNYYPSNNVKIEYSIDNGTTWLLVSASTPNSGSYPWLIPNNPSPYCLVRVSDAITPSINDVSNVNFAIKNPQLTLTSLNCGEFIGCNVVPITWTNTGLANNVKIEVSYDNGLTWNIISNSAPNSGSYNWSVPNSVNSSACLIRISDATQAFIVDQSNAPFTISNNSQIVLYSPNGGENLIGNSSVNVSWLATGVTGNLTLQYSANNGTSWTTISNTVPNTGSYTWTVPNTISSSQCLFKISETITPCKTDQSNAVFSISPQLPVMTITAPNTAVSWIYGAINPITWTISNGTVANIKLEYSINNGNTWTNIIASTPAIAGTYNWSIPNAPSTTCLVRISDVLNSTVFDVSDVNFTIYNAATVQCINVINPNGGDNIDGCTATTINWASGNCTPLTRSIAGATPTVASITTVGSNFTATISGLTSATTFVQPNLGDRIFATSGTGSIGTGGIYTVTAVTATSITYLATGGSPPIAGAITNLSTSTMGLTGNVSTVTGTGPWNGTLTFTGSGTTANMAPGTTFTASGAGIGTGGICTVTSVTNGTTVDFTKVGGTALTNAAITRVIAINTSYKLEYSKDDGTSWISISNLFPQPSNGACTYVWNPVANNINSSLCKVRVTNASNSTEVDASDNVSSIGQPIVILEPNFGGTYVAGTTLNISWTTNGVSGFYDLFQSTDGTNWSLITFNQNITTNSYSWTIPNTATNQLKIRVKESGSLCKLDDSDVNATVILSPQVVVLTSPNGGDQLPNCSTQNITWTSTNANGNYKLEYSINGGSTWTQIATNIASGNAGTYAWTLPNTISTSCLVRVTDIATPANTDQSNAAFSIIQSVPLALSQSNVSICSGQSINLSASGADTYLWSPSNGLSATGVAAPSASPTQTTTYTVIGSINGCTNSKTVKVTVNAIPVVSINQNNVSLCSGVTLQATGASAYSWAPSIGLSNANSFNPMATPSTSTQYTVTGTTNGCSATASATVHPIPTVSISPSTSICAGNSVNLSASGASTYVWSPALSLSSATISNPTASPTSTQLYTVIGTSNGCSSLPVSTTLTVNAAPALTVAACGNICAGSSYNLSSSGAATYSWSPSTGLSNANISNPIATPLATTTYTLNGSNGTCTSSRTITVNVIPTPVISITGNDSICSGNSTQLTVSGGGNYIWNVTTGLSNPYVSNPFSSPSASTNYTVSSTVNGCIGTGSFNLTVLTAPTITPAFTQVPSICAGGILQPLPSTSLNNIVGQWSPNLNNLATTTYTFIPNAGQCAFNNTLTISVNTLPSATITPASATTFCQGSSVLLNANTGSGLMYQWKLNGINISGATASSYTASASGLYSVAVTNTSVCSATSSETTVAVIPNANYFADADGDSFGNPSGLISTCVQPQGYVLNSSDCNDSNAAVNINAMEICNSVDDNCNSLMDDGLTFLNYYADLDSDNYGAGTATNSCSDLGAGYVLNNSDCNDSSASINIATVEICNDIDDNCNSLVDDGLTFLNYYTDLDADTYGAGTATNSCSNLGAGYVLNNSDCNDSNASINIAAAEICNGIDDNCNSLIDDGLTFINYYADLDADTYGAGAANNSCSDLGVGYVLDNSDCNDSDASISIAGTEICNDIDDNCNSLIDDGLTFIIYYADLDADTYGAGTATNSCSDLGVGYVLNNSDCNDSNASINIAAAEICNDIDDNCNSLIDDGLTFIIYYADLDADTYGAGTATNSCFDLGAGYVLDNTDCEDTNAAINPAAEEIGANGIDENCDGSIDNSISELSSQINLFPNPATTSINLQVNSELVGKDFIIYDAVGKVIMKDKITSTLHTINTSELAVGSYILRIDSMNKLFNVSK